MLAQILDPTTIFKCNELPDDWLKEYTKVFHEFYNSNEEQIYNTTTDLLKLIDYISTGKTEFGKLFLISSMLQKSQRW